MSFLHRLLVRLGLRRDSVLYPYQQDEGFRSLISDLARQEQRPEEEIHAGLLAEAFAQRNISQDLWNRWQSLSPREQHVAALTCLGYTNGEIGARLGVSIPTVKTHIRNILSKFQLHAKNELRMTLQDWDFREWDKTPYS
jgi:DNA-binding CsgD family transcriptional regulator